jgi:hypothetical protein
MPGIFFARSSAFATVEANSDYLATEAHYLALAGRIVGALLGGSGFALLTGDPPASPQLLSQALSKATESRHPVIGIPCGPELTYGEVMSAAALVTAVSAAGKTTAVPEFSELTSPLVIFDDVDRLSRALSEPIAVPRPRLGNAGEPSVVVALPTSSRAMIPEPPELASPLFVFGDVHDLSHDQLRIIYEATMHPDWLGAAGVLLARPGFLTRLDEPQLRFLKEHLVAKFEFQEIGQGESIEFRRHQLENRPRCIESRAGRRRLVRSLTGCRVLLTAGIGAFFFAHHVGMVDDPIERSATSTSETREISVSFPAPSKTTSPAPATAGPAAEPPATFPSVLPPAPTAQSVQMLQAKRYATTPTQFQPAGVTKEPPPATPPVFAEALATLQGAPPTASSPPTEPLTGGSFSPTNIAALVTRGDEFLSAGDITSARLFYERAANGGDGPSALRLGATFDPAFLGHAGIRGIFGDLKQASSWYRRARELDAAALQQLSKSAEPRRLAEPVAPR